MRSKIKVNLCYLLNFKVSTLLLFLTNSKLSINGFKASWTHFIYLFIYLCMFTMLMKNVILESNLKFSCCTAKAHGNKYTLIALRAFLIVLFPHKYLACFSKIICSWLHQGCSSSPFIYVALIQRIHRWVKGLQHLFWWL